MYIKDVEKVFKWQYVIILSPHQLRVLKILESHILLTCTLRLWNGCGGDNITILILPLLRVLTMLESQSVDMYIKAVEQVWK